MKKRGQRQNRIQKVKGKSRAESKRRKDDKKTARKNENTLKAKFVHSPWKTPILSVRSMAVEK